MISLRSLNYICMTILGLCVVLTGSSTLQKPLIGIISTPSDFKDLYDPQEFSYIKGSYAEFVEAGDGIPVAIPWDLPERELISVLESVNGILFTGGDATLWEFDENLNDVVFSNFTKRAAFILNYALHLNDKGIHYPVFGICQGHEVIVMGVAGRPHVIDFYRHPGQLDNVEIIAEGKKSRMYRDMPDNIHDFLKERRTMFYHHRYGFNTSLLADNDALDDFFTITAKGADDHDKEFIAALEAKDYPIFTVQYHPERVLSEWNNKTQFDHPEEAAQSIIIQAEFFVSQAMKNQQQFLSEEIKERFLIRGHEGVYVNKTWPNTYFYDKKSPIAYHMIPDCRDCGSNLDEYDCVDHDCSFIAPEAPELEL